MQLQNGEVIHYRLIAGNDTQPYLVFLHEGLGCIAMWKDFPDRLCRMTNCPGLVYDRAGYGKSSPLNRTLTVHFLHEYALNELPEILEKVFPDKEYLLIGHSDGGSISLIFAAEKPSLLKAVITEAAHVFVEPETIKEIKAAKSAYEKGQLRGLYKYHGEKTDFLFKAWVDAWLSARFRFWNIEYLLPSIECPLLVLQGKQDRYGTFRQVESIVAKSSGDAVPVFVENCGHAPHLEQPETVLQILTEYIGKLSQET
ncbi:MAG: alpha/beta hydrolase [Pseudomonadota bacterium]